MSRCVDGNKLSMEELLDTHMGSVHVMSNLYVEGFIFEGRYGGCSNAQVFDTPVVFTKPATFSNDIKVYGSNITFYEATNIQNHDVLTVSGKPIEFANETVYIQNLVIDNISFNEYGINQRAPVFPNLPTPNNIASCISSYCSNTEPCFQATFDHRWTLTLDLAFADYNDKIGTIVGNGKMAMIADYHGIDLQKIYMAVQPRFTHGAYQNNVIETFCPHKISFFDPHCNATTIMQTQQLHMDTGILNTRLRFENNPFQKVSVSYDLYAPRQLPFCTVQSLTLKSDIDQPYIDIFAEMRAPSDVTDVEYNNNVVYSEFITNAGLPVLVGKGRHSEVGDVVCVTAYVYDNDTMAYSFENLGFNLLRKEPTKCYNKFRLIRNDHNVITSLESHTFHVVSVHLSSFDFNNPLDEAKRIIITVLSQKLRVNSVFPTSGFIKSIQYIRETSNKSWHCLWKSNMNICPKVGSTLDEKARVLNVRRCIRYTLYNLYCRVREHIVHILSPTTLGVIDIDGQLLYEGDIWIIPILMFFKPDVARSLLEYRYANLQNAAQLAAGFGYKGLKFPSTVDVIGYKNALYWDSYASMSVFNTAAVAINTWNYFRVTRDKEWLTSKGYPILKGIAEFFDSLVQRKHDGTFVISNTLSLGMRESEENNAFSVCLVKLAFRCCIEASYELAYPTRETWLQKCFGLVIPTFAPPQQEIIRFDAVTLESTSTLKIVEPLLVLFPLYSSDFFSPENQKNRTSAFASNADFYQDKVDKNHTRHPYNAGLLSMMYALAMQYDNNRIVQFDCALQSFLESQIHGPWGNFKLYNCKNEDTNFDLVTGCIFLMVLMQGVCGVEIQGGVAETRFYYDELKIKSRIASNMPKYWKEIQLCGVGPKSENFKSTNQIS